MAERSAIEWTAITWNPTSGCDKISAGCDNCLAPDTPVLMADMSWRPIGKIVPGDEIVGFTETPGLGQNRLYESATVVHVWTTMAEAVEITVGDRTIMASADHRFLAQARPYWREAKRLSLQTRVIDLGMPAWLPDTDSEPYLAGYLAGAIGGDGTLRIEGSGKNETKQSYLRVAVLSSDQPILERMLRALTVLGCTDIAIRHFDGGFSAFEPLGGRAPLSKIETRRMANLITIRDICLPERDDANWKAGFLAGFFDTDGSYSGRNLRFHQTKNNGLLDAARRYISDLGFRSQREDFRSTTGRSERVLGDLEEKIRFLSTTQPALTRKAADFYGRRFPGKHAVKVDGIRRLGIRELVDIQTTSSTFIAAGLATHNCYALTLAKRLKAMGQPKYQTDGDPRTSGPGFGVALHPDLLLQPLRWRKARKVFVDSMADLMHVKVPTDFLAQVWAVMAQTPQHTYQILTKRPERYAHVLDGPCRCGGRHLPGIHFRSLVQEHTRRLAPGCYADLMRHWPLPNVWLGTSIEHNDYTRRADALRAAPAATRFLSLEPLLSPLPSLDLAGIDWVIVGGESGPGYRPLDLGWVREIRDRCVELGIAFFFKQVGGHTPKAGGRLLDGRTWDQFPAAHYGALPVAERSSRPPPPTRPTSATRLRKA